LSAQSSWRTLAEMDLHFARSRRRAAARRREPVPRPKARWRTARIAGLAAILFAVVGGSTTLEISDAGPTSTKAKVRLRSACPVPARFDRAFASAAAKTHLPLSLLVAMAYEESRMNPAARSHAGAQGLFQLMPGTARALALSESVPESNVLGGARYLEQMLARFGSLDLALSAYNAGPTAVEKAGAAPSLETLRYVKNVEARAAVLRSAC
jgi:soluble lytic murein transglycosylase-like protein